MYVSHLNSKNTFIITLIIITSNINYCFHYYSQSLLLAVNIKWPFDENARATTRPAQNSLVIIRRIIIIIIIIIIFKILDINIW